MTDLRESLKHLRQRVNVTTRYPFDGNQLVILYDDHRWLLNVLFKIQKDRLLPVLPKLVFFDSHDDYAKTRKQSQLLKTLGVDSLTDATEKDFSAFVDYEISTDDGNWLAVACELNLISDAVVIGNKFGTNIISEEDLVHKSEDGTEHHLYKLSSDLNYELGGRGLLGDLSRDDEFRGIRQFFDVKYSQDYARIGNMSPFILDYDLDFFTLDTDEGTIAWPLSIWSKHYEHFSMERMFIDELIRKAEAITICREPDFCGNSGLGGANYNLQNLDRFLFNGGIGTILEY